MKVKINHTLFITLSLITLLIAGNYWGIAQFVLPYKARLYILVLSGAIPLLLPLYYKKRSIIIPWMLCFFFVLFRNQEFLSGGYYNSIRLIGAYLFIFASVKSCDWIKKAISRWNTRRIVWVSSGSCRSLLSKWNIYYNSFIDCMGCIFDLKWSRKEAKIYNDSWYCYSYRTSSYI